MVTDHNLEQGDSGLAVGGGEDNLVGDHGAPAEGEARPIPLQARLPRILILKISKLLKTLSLLHCS